MNIINFLTENNYNGDDAQKIREELYKKNISVSYEKKENNPNGNQRFIFTSLKKARKLKNAEINIEANGLILEAPDWKVLVIPTVTPKSNIDTGMANDLIRSKTYDIFYTEDGTIFNLYYYADKWLISSARGIDITDCIFNKYTYSHLLTESLANIGINITEFYDALDKNQCYTFGFKHPDIHPFREGMQNDIFRVWFIQSVLINHGDYTKNSVLRTLPVNDVFKNISYHRPVEFKVHTMGILYSKLKTAFTNFIDDDVVTYGFILIAKDYQKLVSSNNIEYSVLLLESTLMCYIRNLWYEDSYSRFSKNKEFNRFDTILLNSYLDKNRIELFKLLFPQFNSNMDNISKIESIMIDNIYDNLSKAIDTTIVKDVDSTDVNEVNTTSVEDDIIHILCAQVSNILTIDAHDRPKQKIRDIIHDPGNLDYFYKITNQ